MLSSWPSIVAAVALRRPSRPRWPSSPSTTSRSRPEPESTARSRQRPRATDPSSLHAPLPLRLVDSGGVGIPLTTRWGADYSHDTRIFHEVLLDKAPYVDPAAFQRVERDWRAYVERMLAYGNNAIAVPMLLELIDFGRVNARRMDSSVYDADETFRARHAAVRRAFGPLFEWTAQRGMQVFLDDRHADRVAAAGAISAPRRAGRERRWHRHGQPGGVAGLPRRPRRAVRHHALDQRARHPVRRRRHAVQHQSAGPIAAK